VFFLRTEKFIQNKFNFICHLRCTIFFKFFKWSFCDSQPGVHIPLGIHKQFAWGTGILNKNKPTKGIQKGFWVVQEG
jgi:hypothetical protein